MTWSRLDPCWSQLREQRCCCCVGLPLGPLIPHAELHVARGGGHLFLLERPAETADLVAHFLQSDLRPERQSPTEGSSGIEAVFAIVFELDGGDRPACVAEVVVIYS